ncbi:MAG: hypothetical protein KIT57_12450 [Blastocatellales bacterium]|nr:hypothetical protein [Blastocatellales bacterium]
MSVRWAGAVWGLPFLTGLDWQAIHLIMRWLPQRNVIFVPDSSFALLELLCPVSTTEGVSLITRLRLDGRLYDPAPSGQSCKSARVSQRKRVPPLHRSNCALAAHHDPEKISLRRVK